MRPLIELLLVVLLFPGAAAAVVATGPAQPLWFIATLIATFLADFFGNAFGELGLIYTVVVGICMLGLSVVFSSSWRRNVLQRPFPADRRVSGD